MAEKTPVLDCEVLYRSIPNGRGMSEYSDEHKCCIPSSQAFRDAKKQPSVDRASMMPDASDAQFDPSDGVLWLTAAEVRQQRVKKVVKESGKSEEVTYLLGDVDHDPLDKRPSHALIMLTPELGGGSHFKKLLERLQRITIKDRWQIQPAECG